MHKGVNQIRISMENNFSDHVKFSGICNYVSDKRYEFVKRNL